MNVCPRRLSGTLWIIIPCFGMEDDTKLQVFVQSYYMLSKQTDNIRVVEAYSRKPRLHRYVSQDNILQARMENPPCIKEILINLGMKRLPSSCDKIVWAVPGAVFHDMSWIDRVCKYLEHYKIVQPYRQVISSMVTERMGDGRLEDVQLHQNSFAWACRRYVLNGLGLFDKCTENVDRLFASAAMGLTPALHTDDRGYFGSWASELRIRAAGSIVRMPGRISLTYPSA